MLTTKNWAVIARVFFPALMAMLAGCTPAGNRALTKGERLVEAGRYAEAIEEIGAAVAVETNLLSTNASAWNLLGLAYHHTGQAAKAERAYQRALKLNHDLVDAHYNLGCLCLEQGRLEPAKAELISYTSLRGKTVEGCLKLGTVLFRLRDLGAAEQSFGDVLQISAHQPEALNGLGLILLERNRPREAAQHFEDALKQQPDYSPAMLNLAVVCQQHLNNRPLALQKYREYLALPLRPANAETVRAVVARLEQELDVPARATAASAPASSGTPEAKPAPGAASPAKAGAAAEPASKPAQPVPTSSTVEAPVKTNAEKRGFFSHLNPFNWFGSEDAAGSKPSPAAEGRYAYRRPAQPAVGDEAAARRAFGQGLQASQANRQADAIQSYRRAIQLNPAYFEAYYNLGVAAAAGGSLQQALAAYETALVIRPDSTDARYNFAFALKQAKYPLDAASELEKLMASSPVESRTCLALGNLYAQDLRQPGRARELYLKALEIDPHNPKAAAIRQWLNDNPR
jgi:tetratricopeptide (TPR) repeat protein